MIIVTCMLKYVKIAFDVMHAFHSYQLRNDLRTQNLNVVNKRSRIQ